VFVDFARQEHFVRVSKMKRLLGTEFRISGASCLVAALYVLALHIIVIFSFFPKRHTMKSMGDRFEGFSLSFSSDTTSSNLLETSEAPIQVEEVPEVQLPPLEPIQPRVQPSALTDVESTNIPGFTKNYELFLATAFYYPQNNSFAVLAVTQFYFKKGCERYKSHCILVEDDAPDDWKSGVDKMQKHPQKEIKPWKCRIPELMIETDVKFGPEGATVDSKSNDVAHSILCYFKESFRDHVHTKPFVNLQLFQDRENIAATIKISTKVKVAGNFIPEQFPERPHPDFPFYSVDDTGLATRPVLNVCMSGLHNVKSVYWALEWVVHHLSIGAHHIFIGVYANKASDAWKVYSKLFEKFILEGKVSLICTYIPGLWWKDHSQYREFFDNECLYFGKLKGDFVGVWDIDETLFPKTEEPAINILQKVIADSGRTLPETCSFTFEAFSPSRGKGFQKEMGFLGDRFPLRVEHPENAWKKTVVYAPNVFQSGIHIPGGCAMSGDIYQKIHPTKTPGSYLVNNTLMTMWHWRDVFKKRTKENSWVPNEYNSVWNTRNRNIVCTLFKEGAVDKEWYRSYSHNFIYNCPGD